MTEGAGKCEDVDLPLNNIITLSSWIGESSARMK